MFIYYFSPRTLMEPEFYVWGVLLVFILGALFILTSTPLHVPAFGGTNSPTGQVIAEEDAPEPCGCIPDKPICGAIDHTLNTYLSECHAECAGAKIVFEKRCTSIPTIS